MNTNADTDSVDELNHAIGAALIRTGWTFTAYGRGPAAPVAAPKRAFRVAFTSRKGATIAVDCYVSGGYLLCASALEWNDDERDEDAIVRALHHVPFVRLWTEKQSAVYTLVPQSAALAPNVLRPLIEAVVLGVEQSIELVPSVRPVQLDAILILQATSVTDSP